MIDYSPFWETLKNSTETTYTLIRTRDLECALSDEVKEFLKENEIELITYDDLKEVL